MKTHDNFQHTLLMLLVCLLPIFLFFILAVSGFQLSPLFFFLFLAICCFAMFYFMGRMHPQTDSETGRGVDVDQFESQENPGEAIPVPENMAEVFQSLSSQRKDDTIVFEGNLLTDAETAFQKLKESSDRLNVSTFLQEDDAGRTLLIVAKKRTELTNPAPSRPIVNLALFALTFLTTAYAGALHQGINLLKEPEKFAVGLPYAVALMAILGAHELGHYFAAKRHKMQVTLPYFIPVPFALGTFGAFIRLKSPSENRKALFDVGIAGPLAGLALAIPALFIGLQNSQIIPLSQAADMAKGANIGSSIMLTLLAKLSLGDALSYGHSVVFSPLAFAGWLGFFVTALNLLPVGQLDGGHIAHALFGRKNANTIGMVALFSLLLLGLFVWSGLLTWAIIIFFIAGIKSAPPLNDVTGLDGKRVVLGLVAFVILFMILIPLPHSFYESLGINCPYA